MGVAVLTLVCFIKVPAVGVPILAVLVGRAIEVTIIVPAGSVPPLPCTNVGVMSRIVVGVPVTTVGVVPCFGA